MEEKELIDEYKRDEARELYQDMQEEEFNQTYSVEDVVTDMLENLTKEEIVELLIDCEVENHDDYYEHRKIMCAEYWENR